MKSVEPTELPALSFNKGQEKQPYHSQSEKVGWLRVFTKPGTKFNMSIRDGLGRSKFERQGLEANPDGQFGELINMQTMVGENLEVEVTGLHQGTKADVFLN